MPVVFDEVSADVAAPQHGQERRADDDDSAKPPRIEDRMRELLELQQRRRERLSDQ